MSRERVTAELAPTMGIAGLARSPGAVVSGVIAAAASTTLLTAGVVPWLIMLAVVLAAWWGAIWWGSHGVAIASVALTLMTAGFGVATSGATSVLPWTLVGLLGVIQLDAHRLAVLGRRHGRLADGVVAHVLRGTGGIVLASLAGALLVDGITDQTSAVSWLAVPATATLVLVLAAGVLIGIGRGRSPEDADRWTPGHRLPTHTIRLERAPDQPPPPRPGRTAGQP